MRTKFAPRATAGVGNHPNTSCVWIRFPPARETRRSDSGAAVRRTRGGALYRDCSSGAKTVCGFRAALGRAGDGEAGRTVGRALFLAFAIHRIAGPVAQAAWRLRGNGRQAEWGGALGCGLGEVVAGRSQRGLKRAPPSCGPTPGVALARAALRAAESCSSVYSERQRN